MTKKLLFSVSFIFLNFQNYFSCPSSGVFVRIKDKNLHVECFKCSTCGTSLKNQGYYNLNNKLYCDIHARLAALNSPPPNANGMVPVTVPPYVFFFLKYFIKKFLFYLNVFLV